MLLYDFFYSTIFNYFSLKYFYVGWIFCSQTHEHREEHQKGNNFSSSLWFFAIIFNYFSYLLYFVCWMNILLSYSWTWWRTQKKVTTFFLLCDFLFFYHIQLFFLFCSIILLDRCFALRFMNTRNVTTFLFLCDFLFFYHI